MAVRHEQEPEHGSVENRRESSRISPQSRAKTLIAALVVAIPPIFFYTVLFRKSLNIPFLDDYDALLNFMNEFVQLRTISARTSYILADQHGEIKLFFMQGLACLQFYLAGHIDFRVLSAIANGSVLFMAILLWKMFLPTNRDFASRLAWFIPVPWLIFQLQYYEALNFATVGLQHVVGLVFSLGAIYLLVRGERWAFFNAAGFLILAVASDGDGLLLIPLGLLILILARRHARAVGWLIVSAGCIAAYAYRYDPTLSATHAHQSIFSVAMRFNPAFVIAFIGGAASFPFHFKAGRLILGSLLCIFFVYMTWRGYARKNPAVAYCVLFLLLTATGVAGLRSDFGFAYLPSRYMIFSALFLTFAWFVIVEEFLQYSRAPLLDNGIFLCAVAAAVLFSLTMDLIGFNLIERRNRDLVQAMTQFEHPSSPDAAPSPAPVFSMPDSGGLSNAWNLRARETLLRSIRLGVYRPPPL
jgi:hypothetical protein